MKNAFRIILTIVILAGSNLPFVGVVHAAGKFETTIKREYWLNNDLSVTVKETETIKNNTSNLYIPSGGDKKFDILAIEQGDPENPAALAKTAQTVELTYNQEDLTHTKQVGTDRIILDASFPASLNSGQSATFVLEYTHYGMMESNGALKDFFLNGFASDSVFSDNQNNTSYQTIVYVPASFAETNFVLPENVTTGNADSYKTFTFKQSDLVDHYVWIQFGKTQYYKFEISQKINPSEVINTGNKNRYEIVIPRSIDEAEITQEIFYEEVSPDPEWVKEDSEGNLLASFKLGTNFSGEIVIRGYAQITRSDDVEKGEFGALSLIPQNFDRYLGEDEYWQVDVPAIVAQAEALKGDKTDIYEILTTTYDFVVDRIDYSEVKRFGINERQGAVATLNGGAAVCMEYSDLFLTLMRAQGVPARAAFGYGYDPKEADSGQEAHQWVEVYAPNLSKWVSVDVTWGESGPALIGGDLNHFYTHVASLSPNEPPGIATVGYGELQLEPADYSINVVENFDPDGLLGQADVLSKYEYSGQDNGENLLELTNSKLDATYSNLINGERLSTDQIFILAFGGVSLIAIVFATFGIARRLRNFLSRKPRTMSM